MSIYAAAVRYVAEGTPLIVVAGREYGSGSSRDWAAKGPALQGVRAVIAQSFERIHRSNLVGMGILPLQFREEESAESLGLDGRESFTITGIAAVRPGGTLTVLARREGGEELRFEVTARLELRDRRRLLPQRRHPADGAAPADGGPARRPLISSGDRGAGGRHRKTHTATAAQSVADEGLPDAR